MQIDSEAASFKLLWFSGSRIEVTWDGYAPQGFMS